jgi:hypothetical protein
VTVSAPMAPSMLETVVPFDYNDFHLNMAALLEVEKIADLMSSHPETQVELVGHTDATGTETYNVQLSFRRAEEIAAFLERKSIQRKRVLVDGKGESSPLALERNTDGSDSPLGRYLNRRVQVTLAGSLPVESELAGIYVPESLKINKKPEQQEAAAAFLYTIQVSAARSAISISRFSAIGEVKEYHCSDGYYRYAVGSYRTFPEATKQLKDVRSSGFGDAFIQTLAWYERAMK